MLINPFQPEWQSDLNRRHEALPFGARLMLLIDGAFVPRLFRQLGSASEPVLLFEFLPGCSKEAKEVSPFVVSFDPSDKSLVRLLKRCSGWPMLSVLTTYESAERLAKRLAAWCIVEVDGQNFNFRFPDTRRLPMIFETLTQQQRREFIGNAIGWHYISRDGSWSSLPLEPSTIPLSISDKATLDEIQFARLLKDSDPDEVWVQLLDRGARTHLPPSQRHALLSNALHLADKNGLDDILKIAWCMDCIEQSCQSDSDTLRTRLAEWKQETSRTENETSYRTA
ncbi:DUF4123 domain-containing protein [Massilia sp. CMS3.1]|uniref:DUF4123 domain-containing protein n=1 Tax=Massilia sp. CMS3.1 TaxID=3373083 RepID=UPI003EE492F9